ncbi:MAG: protein-L-isoaspartate(D-aspartate) O-methyltransferase [Oleispira sp.]|nr:protein-L-isoaspartate(D-aspartate) O-methyltransferase [Oleispira sp.]
MNDQQLAGIGMTSQRTRNRLIQRLRDKGIENQQVLEVMASTPRHLFIDEALAHRAYEDTALPIGNGQTISQPYIVAKMTELLLAAGPLHNVLEVGTGSGYQTSILAPLVKKLYSVERIEPLLNKARQRIRQLKLNNVSFKLSDGHWGWSHSGPYDGIIAAAAPEDIPQGLLDQMADGGRMVLPVGGEIQSLILVTRSGDSWQREVLEDVKFVPFLAGIKKS